MKTTCHFCISILALVIIFAIPVRAQFAQGTVYLSGGFGYASTNNTTTNSFINGPSSSVTSSNTSFSLYPRLGVAITPNAILGVEFGYGQLQTTRTEPYFAGVPPVTLVFTTANTVYGGSLFVRWHFPISENLHFVLQPSAGFYWSRTPSVTATAGSPAQGFQVTATTFELVASTFTLSVQPSFQYFLSPKWAIELGFSGLGYQNTASTSTGTGLNREIKSNTSVVGLGVDNPTVSAPSGTFDIGSILTPKRLSVGWYINR
jgi:hypothetical protein